MRLSKKWLLLGLLVIAAVVANSMDMPWQQPPMSEVFAGQPMPRVNTQPVSVPALPSYQLQYQETGDLAAPAVLLIHGTPGQANGWSATLADKALNRHMRLVAVDRPGFGATGGPVLATLSDQAKVLAPLLQKLHEDGGRPVIVAGHSLGGPVAVQIALDYPQHVRSLYLLAASLDPALEAPRWYNHWAEKRLLRWLLPNAMLRANLEVMRLQSELAAMQPRLSQLTIPIVLLQGGKDKLVYPGNADYAERHMTNAQLQVQRVPQGDHFLHWREPKRVRAALLSLF